MAQIIAVTDENGKVLGVVRGDPVEIGDGMTIKAVASSTPGQHYHALEVDNDLLGQLASEVHREVERRLRHES
jgi:hypothetical protein